MTTIKNANWEEMMKWELESHEYKAIQEIGNKHHDKKHWKNPVNAVIIDASEAQKLVHWINAFHGCQAEIKIISVEVRHPEGLISFNMDAFEISSLGYSC